MIKEVNSNKSLLVVNLFGSPGSGKSTGAAYIFSQLKLHNINCELVTEYVKDMVWEENTCAVNNQLYLLGNQYYRLCRLQGKVDVVITDSPLPLNIIYNPDKEMYGNCFNDLVINVFDSFHNVNYFVNRCKPYNPKGRIQSEEESKQLAVDIKNLLKKNNIPIISEIEGKQSDYDKIVKEILSLLELRKSNQS